MEATHKMQFLCLWTIRMLKVSSFYVDTVWFFSERWQLWPTSQEKITVRMGIQLSRSISILSLWTMFTDLDFTAQ